MTNLIVASFQDEAQAVETFQKLNQLESIGDITVYEMVVVKKDAGGQTVVLQAVTSEGSETLTDMAVGTVIGALAGPVGLVVGMLAGTLTGAAAEADDFTMTEGFLKQVTDGLQPGMSAVVAEVEEDDPVFIDSTLTLAGASLTRTDVTYEYNKDADEEIEEFDEDILEVRDKLKTAAGEEKDKFRRKILKIKAKRKDRITELKEKANQVENTIKDSINDKKAARLRGKIEKHQKKISELEKKLGALLEKDKVDHGMPAE